MLMFSTSLFLFFIAVSEQQESKVNFEEHDLSIKNTMGVLRRIERNAEYDRRVNSTKQTAGKINQVPCSDLRLIYDTLRYHGSPKLFAPNSLSQWKPITPVPVSDEEEKMDDHQFSQHQPENIQKLPRKQVSQAVQTQSPENTNVISLAVKYPENNTEHITQTVPKPININKHEPFAYILTKIKHKPSKISNNPAQSVENEEESLELYISERKASSEINDKLPTSEKLPDFNLKQNKTTKIDLQKQSIQVDYLESRTEPILAFEKLPEYSLDHRHDEAIPYKFEISTVKSSEIDQRSNKPAQSVEDKEEPIEPYISERKASSEIPTSEKIPYVILKYNKTTKNKLQRQPVQEDYLESRTEGTHSSEELPEYIFNHKHNEAVPYHFDISTVKSSDIDQKAHKIAQRVEDREVYNGPTSEKLLDFNFNPNKTSKINPQRQPIQVDHLESRTEAIPAPEELSEYIFDHKHNKVDPYHFEISTVKSSEKDRDSKKPAQSIEHKEQSTELYVSDRRALSEINEGLPTFEDTPEYIIKQKHNDTDPYHFEISTVKSSELDQKSQQNAQSIEDEESTKPYISDRIAIFDKDLKSNKSAEHIKDNEESTEPTSESRSQISNERKNVTKSFTNNDINKTMHESKHSNPAAPVSCMLNKEESTENSLSPEFRRKMSLGTDSLTTANVNVPENKPKTLKVKEKEISAKVKPNKDDKDNSNRYGYVAYPKANILPLPSIKYPGSNNPGLLQPTYHLMDPTKGAGISPLSDPKTLMMESTKVCYACSSLTDASCRYPDRTTTVKYCRPGYDLCVTKIYKSITTMGMIVIRDCNSACDVNTPGLDTHYDSCAICKEDLCNNLPVENSAFTFSQSNILPILVIGGLIRFMFDNIKQ